MADQGNAPLEEHLRRMILTDEHGSNQESSPAVAVVRLPSRQAYGERQTQASVGDGSIHRPTTQAVYAQSQSAHGSLHTRQQQYPRHPQQSSQQYQNVRPAQQSSQQEFNPRHVQQAPQAYGNNQRFQGYPPPPSLRSNASNYRGQQMSQQSHQPRQLFDPASQSVPVHVQHQLKAQYLQSIVDHEIPLIEMSQEERQEKEAFRVKLQQICQELCATDPEQLPAVELYCFGSFQSGFASAGSDMDLVIVPKEKAATAAQFSLSEYDLPRRLELRLLQLGLGARLLSRTRVPIIKVCESPSRTFLDQLREERSKWNMLSFEAKYPHLREDEEQVDGEPGATTIEEAEAVGATDDVVGNAASASAAVDAPELAAARHGTAGDASTAAVLADSNQSVVADPPTATTTANKEQTTITSPADPNATQDTQNEQKEARPRRVNAHPNKAWLRERKAGPLDFPKDGVGIQSDINFFNPLGLHNTHMLRCYSLCDPRVRPMVLLVKAWAKKRKINSAYSGTLSSYGYVLMVLHFLVNVVRPPVLPNLQLAWRPHPTCTAQGTDIVQMDEWTVDFWRREDEIINAASKGMLSSNHDPLGHLLASFFSYYASQSGRFSFHWMQQVLSLRTPGGIMTKEEKGWVKSRTEETEGKKVQFRYLFCIEDPFELDHNVARTVTHYGIIAIRDEFRRASRILIDVAMRQPLRDGELFDALQEPDDDTTSDVKQQAVQQAAKQLVGANIDTKDEAAFPTLAPAQAKPVPAKKKAINPVQSKQHEGGHKSTIPQGGHDKRHDKASLPKESHVKTEALTPSTPIPEGHDEVANDKSKKHYRRKPQRAQRKIVLNTDSV